MLNLSSLKPKIKKLPRVRRGRGLGSGRGAYSGRGIKGQKARTGGSIRPGFEGGRMPLIRQMPKAKGFRSPHVKPETVSLETIVRVFPDGSVVSPKTLAERGLIGVAASAVKVLGKTEISRKYTFENVKLSKGARLAVEKAGGIIKEIETPKK